MLNVLWYGPQQKVLTLALASVNNDFLAHINSDFHSLYVNNYIITWTRICI